MRCVGNGIRGFIHRLKLKSDGKQALFFVAVFSLLRRAFVNKEKNKNENKEAEYSSEDIKASAPSDEQKSSEGKKKFYNSVPFIVIASVLAVAAVFWIAIGLAAVTTGRTIGEVFGIEAKRLDYINDDLSDYIDIEDSDYKGYDVYIDIPKPTLALDVEQHIINLIYKNRGDMLNDYMYQYDVAMRAGDRAFVFYAAYEYDKDGNRVEIPSLTNYSDTDAAQINIGGGKYPLGFELALVGKNPKDTPAFSAKRAGFVADGDVVYLTASFVSENGISHHDEHIRIDLSDEHVEEVWGSGILSYLQEMAMGQVNSNPIILNTAKGKIYYTSIKIDYATTCESDGGAMVIEARYPYDYEDESLRNKTVYFDVFVDKVMCYDSHDFDDAFITDVLKMSADELSSYEGATLTEKYKNYALSTLVEEYEENCSEMAEELVWDYLKKNLNYTLPEKEYKKLYSEYYNYFVDECTKANQSGYSTYESVDDYIIAYYGLDEETDVGEFLRATVKDDVYTKLIFYTIARRENLLPDDSEFDEVYRRELELDFEFYSGKNKDDYATEAEYEKALSDYEKTMLDYYGEAYYRNLVYYNDSIDEIINFANIIKK